MHKHDHRRTQIAYQTQYDMENNERLCREPYSTRRTPVRSMGEYKPAIVGADKDPLTTRSNPNQRRCGVTLVPAINDLESYRPQDLGSCSLLPRKRSLRSS